MLNFKSIFLFLTIIGKMSRNIKTQKEVFFKGSKKREE